MRSRRYGGPGRAARRLSRAPLPREELPVMARREEGWTPRAAGVVCLPIPERALEDVARHVFCLGPVAEAVRDVRVDPRDEDLRIPKGIPRHGALPTSAVASARVAAPARSASPHRRSTGSASASATGLSCRPRRARHSSSGSISTSPERNTVGFPELKVGPRRCMSLTSPRSGYALFRSQGVRDGEASQIMCLRTTSSFGINGLPGSSGCSPEDLVLVGALLRAAHVTFPLRRVVGERDQNGLGDPHPIATQSHDQPDAPTVTLS